MQRAPGVRNGLSLEKQQSDCVVNILQQSEYVVLDLNTTTYFQLICNINKLYSTSRALSASSPLLTFHFLIILAKLYLLEGRVYL